MKLSEGMILGATLARHTHYGSGEDGEGCAIQLAGLAGCNDGMHWIHQQRATCPECSHGILSTVGGVIVCLNDKHEWPIDRIAQWVASIEPPDPAEPLAAAPAEQQVEATLETVPGPISL